MTDGIGSRSAGVCNDGQGTGAAQVFRKIESLALWLIMSHASRLATAGSRRFDCLAIIILAQRHAAAGGAQHERDVARCPAGLFPRFLRGAQQHFTGPIQPAHVFRMSRSGRIRQIHFGGVFYTLTRNVK